MNQKYSDAEVERLKSELEEARAEVEQLRAERELAGRSLLGLGKLGAWLVIGPGLVKSFENWMEAKSLRDPLPTKETAQVWAAVVRRVFAVGALGLVVALLPTALLLWQNLLFRQQISQTQEQINQQIEDTYRVRKAELVRTIYDTKERCEEESTAECPVLAGKRAREEAVLALVTIEKGKGRADLVESNLSGLNLSEANLDSANLHSANLSSADISVAFLDSAILSSADLTSANLRSANLRNANLHLANLQSASLTMAFLHSANLGGADFTNADLTYAIFTHANLSDADFTNADLGSATYITQEQLNSANGDISTVLPNGLEYPEHWLRSSVEAE